MILLSMRVFCEITSAELQSQGVINCHCKTSPREKSEESYKIIKRTILINIFYMKTNMGNPTMYKQN